ncbi:hypothetical protein IT397_01315 [Candidatus Nomurabacteria bacterium]|nr:hypothetical protein [Candidatus Nomurabacteria bacterium]
MFNFSFINFNLAEGTFWIILGIIFLVFGLRSNKLLVSFWYTVSINFLLFGISDYVEAFYPVSFLSNGGEWLFLWKIFNVLIFIISFFWYLYLRIKK